jgi:hypothetical protein
MSPPIDALGPLSGPRRLRRRGAAGRADAAGADQAEAPSETSAAAPIPAVSPRPEDALSAHLIGQSGPAENADAPANSARHAHSTYLSVEWSGPRDRRTRRGRIAKTDI